MNEPFDADYFLRGQQTGKSLYEDYRWLPDLTIPMVRNIANFLDLNPNHTVLDFGCARGYVVKAFRKLGYAAFGIDTSKWAIDNADPEVYGFVSLCSQFIYHEKTFSWVIAKDVLEHVPRVADTVQMLMNLAVKGVFAVVPLGDSDGYVVPEYEKDVTHLHRWPLSVWAGLFMQPGWSVEVRYRIKGVKDNYAQHPYGNGFITCRRLSG